MKGNWDEVIQAFKEIYQRSISESSHDFGRQEVNRHYAEHAHGILNLIPRLRNYPDLRNVTVGTSHYNLFIEVPNTEKWLFVWCELPGPKYTVSYYANDPGDPDEKVIVNDDVIVETIFRLIKEFQEHFAPHD
jgi:hypothetical protein